MSTLKRLGAASAAILKNLIGPMVGRDAIADAVGYITNAGVPSAVVPEFIGQHLLDTTNSVWYKAYGVAAGEWGASGPAGLSAAELAVLDGATAGTAVAGKAVIADSNFATAVGAINAATGLSVAIQKVGAMVQLDFTLSAVSMTVTDAAGSGSSASLKIFDFVQAGIQPIASRQNYTAFAEGAALTGGAGDAAFVMGLGSAAADAGDAALTGTEVDFAPVTGTITLSGGTGTGTKFGGQGTVVDGTTTAADLYLNWSGSAATIDANSTISVTGTITLLVALLGDD